ncbi:MAG: hypothetical protein M3Z00_03865 [Actinomycetota bacterium]|nr:hypothetical protein [Actinomycetota bacterium]
MLPRSRSFIAAVAAVGLVLAGCSTQTAGTAEAAASAGTLQTTDGAPGSSPTDGAPGSGHTDGPSAIASTAGGDGAAVDPQTWAQQLQDGMTSVTSLTGSVEVIGPIKERATLKETLKGGRLKAAEMAMSLVESGSSIPINMRLINGRAYLGGAAIISLVGSKAAGKQWVLLDAGSSDPTIAAIGKSIGSMLQLAGTESYVFFAKAAKSITTVGMESVGSFDATKYAVDIDLTKIAAVLPPDLKDYGQQIEASGMTDVKSTYWIEDHHRVVKTAVGLTVHGITQHTTVTIDAFNVPVTIEAPAASTVYNG